MLNHLTQYDVSFHPLPSVGYSLNNVEIEKGKANHKKIYAQIMLIDCSEVKKRIKIENNQKVICG